MKKVQYSSYYLPYDDCKANHFDPRSEIIGEMEGLTYAVVMSPLMEPTIRDALNEMGEKVRSLTRQEKQEKNEYWESTFTEIVNPSQKTIDVRLFENEDYLYRISFKGVEKIDAIK